MPSPGTSLLRSFAAITLSFVLACRLFAADPNPVNPVKSPPPVVDTGSATNNPVNPSNNPVHPVQVSPSAVDTISVTNRIAAVAPPGPSKNVIINLINRLMKRGALTKEDCDDLIQQAEEDARQAKAAEEASKGPSKSSSPVNGAEGADSPDLSGDALSVPYVPEVVKQQIRDEVREDVMKKAREENWASPRAIPEWVKRWRLLGDFRLRYEGDHFNPLNRNNGSFQFADFNKINNGSPLDVGSAAPVTGGQTGIQPTTPFVDTSMERQRFRLRARGGAEVDLEDNFMAGMRAGSGESDSPVSENQSLGVSNQGQGGDFSKYQLWLDRAFLKYHLGESSSKDLTLSAGRFDNPFMGSTLMWAKDLGFDGFAASGKYEVVKGVTPFLTAGFFPVFNNDLNFGTYQTAKFKSRDKWLEAIQMGADWKVTKDLDLKVAGGYFDFDNIEGKVSHPYFPQGAWDQSDADNSRPSFAQTGNTYTTIRNIKSVLGAPPGGNSSGTVNQWQYFGLVTPFRDVDLVMNLDYSGFDPIHVWVLGDYTRNVAWNFNGIMRSGAPVPNGAANAGPINNLDPVSGAYQGGNSGWLMTLNIGKPALEKMGDWNVSGGYRHVESDSVVDGFTDSDFGGGGANLKGYTVGGNFALGSHVWFGVTWMSADAIAGPVFKYDILQVDLNARF